MKRYEYIMEYLTSFVSTDIARDMMANWGIKVGMKLLEVPGRVLPGGKFTLACQFKITG